VAKIALRDREHLALIQSQDSTMLVNTLNWPDEIRSTEELNLPQNVKISDKEVAMATSLIDNLTDEFQPQRYTDDYKAAFQQIIDQKMQGLEVTTPAPVQEPKVMDLMAALKASVEATRQGKKAPAAKPAAARAAKVKVAAKTTAARPAAKRRTA
jgi:DNA end-binding protein Ku